MTNEGIGQFKKDGASRCASARAARATSTIISATGGSIFNIHSKPGGKSI